MKNYNYYMDIILKTVHLKIEIILRLRLTDIQFLLI
jgi:hypothetical protein